MSQKDLAISQTSQKRFSRTKAQKTQRLVVQKQTIITTNQRRVRTKSQSQSQVSQSIKTQEDQTYNKKNQPFSNSKEVAIYQSQMQSQSLSQLAYKSPNQPKNLSIKKKQQSQQFPTQKKQQSQDTMALSQEIRQALKRVQRYDKHNYAKLSQKQLGQSIKNQVSRLEKIKNSKKQMRSKFYDTQLLAIALSNHVKFISQINKQNGQLLAWKNQRQKQLQQQQQALKKSTFGIKQKLQQQKIKQEQLIEKQLNEKDYTSVKNSLGVYLRKFEKETSIQISKVQITLINHMKILIQEKQKSSKMSLPPLQPKTEIYKQSTKKSLTPDKLKLQKEQLKQLQAIDTQLSTKNYPTAKNLIKSYIKRFEKQEQLSTANEIAVFSYLTIMIDELQALKNTVKQNNNSLEKQRSKSSNVQQKGVNKSADLQVQKLKVNLQSQKIKYQQLVKKNQQNQKIIRQLKSNTTERQLTKLKNQKQKLSESLQKQKNKVNQFSKRIQDQRVAIIQIQRRNKQLSNSKTKPQASVKVTTVTVPGKQSFTIQQKVKAQSPQSLSKYDPKLKVKQLTKQVAQWEKEDAKNKRQIQKLQKLVLKLQQLLGIQKSNLQDSKQNTSKSVQKNQKSKIIQKSTIKVLTKHEIMNRQREIQRQKLLIEGHLRDRHYYYAKPMLISFLRNFEQVQGYQQLMKYFSYFLGIIDDLDLARKQVSDAKLVQTVIPPKTPPKKQQKSQELIIVQKELREIRTILIQKQQIYTQINTTITKLVQIIEGGGQWWKKLPKRNMKSSQQVSSLYRIIDKFRQSETQKDQRIVQLQRKIEVLNENSEQVIAILTILRAVQSILKKKQYLGNQKDPWAQVFKGINTKKQIYSILNRVLNSLVNQNKNKFISQRRNYQNSIKNYEKQIASLTMKVQQVQSKLKRVQQQSVLKSSEKKSTKIRDQQKQKNDQNYRLLQQYILQQKKMLKQLQKIENQKQNIHQRYTSVDIKFKENAKDLAKSNKRIKQLEDINAKLIYDINSMKQQVMKAENEKNSLKASIQKQFKGDQSRIIQDLERKWNSERANFQKQIRTKQNLLNSKQIQLKQQFQRQKTKLTNEVSSMKQQIIRMQKEKAQFKASIQKQLKGDQNKHIQDLERQWNGERASLQRQIITKQNLFNSKENQLRQQFQKQRTKLNNEITSLKQQIIRISSDKTELRASIEKQFKGDQKTHIQALERQWNAERASLQRQLVTKQNLLGSKEVQLRQQFQRQSKKWNNQIDSLKQHIIKIQNDKAELRINIEKQFKGDQKTHIQALERQWNAERASLQRQLTTKQNMLNSKEFQLRQQFQRQSEKWSNQIDSLKQQIIRIQSDKAELRINIEKQFKGDQKRHIEDLQRQWSAERSSLERQITAKENLINSRETQLRQQFQRENSTLAARLEKQYLMKQAQIRQTMVQEFRIKQQILIKQFNEKQKSIIGQTSDLQVRQLNSKLLKLESQLNRYIIITQNKEMQIHNLREEMEKTVGQQIQKALKAQQGDFNQFLKKNDKEREQYFESVVLPKRRQEWRVQYTQFVKNLGSMTKPVQQITINVNEERIKIQNQWKQKILIKERQFESKISQDRIKFQSQWRERMATKQRQFEYQMNQERNKIQNQWRQKMLIKERQFENKLNQQRSKIQNQWRQKMLTKERQFETKLNQQRNKVQKQWRQKLQIRQRQFQSKISQVRSKTENQLREKFLTKQRQLQSKFYQEKSKIQSQWRQSLLTKEPQLQSKLYQQRNKIENDWKQRFLAKERQFQSKLSQERSKVQNQWRERLSVKQRQFQFKLYEDRSKIENQWRQRSLVKEREFELKLQSKLESKLNQQKNKYQNQLRQKLLAKQKQTQSKFYQERSKVENQWRERLSAKQRQFQLKLNQQRNKYEGQWRQKVSIKEEQFQSKFYQEKNKIENQWRQKLSIKDRQFQFKLSQERNRIENQWREKLLAKDRQLQSKLYEQRNKVEDQWKNKTNLKQRQFQNRISQIISDTDKKWSTQIQKILQEKEVQWHKKFASQLKEESQRLKIERNNYSVLETNNLIAQKQNEWNQQLLRRLQQQRLRISREKDDQYLRISRQREANWNQMQLTKERQWQNTLFQRQREIRIQFQNTVVKQPQNQQMKLLRQIINNQKIQLSQMKILLEKVQLNNSKNAHSQHQTILKIKQIELQHAKNLYQIKSQYQLKINSLEKDIAILQDKLAQAEISVNNYKSANQIQKESKKVLMELQKQIIILQNSIQSKDNQITYLKKNIDNLQIENRQQRGTINQLRLKYASNQNNNNNQNQNKNFELQYTIKMLKEREQGLLRQIQSNEIANTQLRRNYQRKINQLQNQNSQQHKQFLKISKLNQRLKQDIQHLQSELRKNQHQQAHFQSVKLKHILKSIQIQKEKQKKVYLVGDSDQTQMQILRRINIEVGQLVQTNRHLQMKLILMQKQSELNAYSPDAINFFLMMQHRLQILINFLLQNQYITDTQTYSQFLQKSKLYIKEIKIEQYFNQFTKLMKQLFHQVYQLNSEQIQIKAKQLNDMKIQMRQILNKQIEINDESQYQKQYYNHISSHANHINNHYHHDMNNDGINVNNNSNGKALHDIRFLMKEYLRRRDEQCLGVVCRTLGLQF